jgi:hypothetical protein
MAKKLMLLSSLLMVQTLGIAAPCIENDFDPTGSSCDCFGHICAETSYCYDQVCHEVPKYFNTEFPTIEPSDIPSIEPTAIPSELPTNNPSEIPSVQPTLIPSTFPTHIPSQLPTRLPTQDPTSRQMQYNLTFLNDFETFVGYSVSDFLEKCTTAIQKLGHFDHVICIEVFSGSIIVTLEGPTNEVEGVVSIITKSEGLLLHNFGALILEEVLNREKDKIDFPTSTGNVQDEKEENTLIQQYYAHVIAIVLILLILYMVYLRLTKKIPILGNSHPTGTITSKGSILSMSSNYSEFEEKNETNMIQISSGESEDGYKFKSCFKRRIENNDNEFSGRAVE